jgi:hypothetical protein
MSTNIEVQNKLKIVEKASLKNLILNGFTEENGKFFYSIEVTAKSGLKLDYTQFNTLPLFTDITWIKNDNLKAKSVYEAPAFDLARKITSSQVVNSVTCYTLTDEKLDEIMSDCDAKNYTILRGGELMC